MNMPKQRDKSLPCSALRRSCAALPCWVWPTVRHSGRRTTCAITIYSSAQPGAIPPEYYRPLPGQGAPPAMGVPGYAMVRQERDVQLAAGARSCGSPMWRR